MTDERVETAEWLELSGLPERLNTLRTYGWSVFRKIVELDCRRNRIPRPVEVSLGELGRRCGLDWEKTGRIVEALIKKKYLAGFLPDNPDEPGLFQIRIPVETPVSAQDVAAAAEDPALRDSGGYRYLVKPAPDDTVAAKTQELLDLYLNALSQKVNSFIVEEAEIIARRYPMEKIRKVIDRARLHDVHTIGWVARELMRDDRKPSRDKTPE